MLTVIGFIEKECWAVAQCRQEENPTGLSTTPVGIAWTWDEMSLYYGPKVTIPPKPKPVKKVYTPPPKQEKAAPPVVKESKRFREFKLLMNFPGEKEEEINVRVRKNNRPR